MLLSEFVLTIYSNAVEANFILISSSLLNLPSKEGAIVEPGVVVPRLTHTLVASPLEAIPTDGLTLWEQTHALLLVIPSPLLDFITIKECFYI